MIILNNGPVPVRVAGQWLQPGASLSVADDLAQRMMAANPDVVEPGKEPVSTVTLPGITEKASFVAFAVAGSEPVKPENKPTEDLPAVEPEVSGPSATPPTKRKR